MFSKKVVVIVAIIILVAANIIALSISSRHQHQSTAPGRTALFFIAPFQKIVSRTVGFLESVWTQYFFLVSLADENRVLKKALSQQIESDNRCNELERSNTRLRNLLGFQETIPLKLLAAEIIAKDPSRWFKSVIIDKGQSAGVMKGMPVVVAEGIVGVVVESAAGFSKVLLMIDQNSAVDALVQRTRARGIVQGGTGGDCLFKYVLRKDELNLGDIVVSSGLDGTYPKGLRIGHISDVIRHDSGIFQQVSLTPFVDFEKLEEVLVIIAQSDPLPETAP